MKSKKINKTILKPISISCLSQIPILLQIRFIIIDFFYFGILTHNIYITLLTQYIIVGEKKGTL